MVINMTKSEALNEILAHFKEYYDSLEGQQHVRLIEAEKKDVHALMKKLSEMDRNRSEFVDLVLYGLLPYSKSKYAKRVSLYSAFLNIKLFFRSYNYTEDDWKKIANKIFDLCLSFQQNSNQLSELINEFVNDKYSRRFQCGSITPILYCINDNYPVINNRVKWTYAEIMRILGKKDEIQQKLMYYPENIQKLKKFVQDYGYDIVNNYNKLDMFCYWYDEYVLKEQPEEEKEPEQISPIEEIDVPSFFKTIDISKSEYEPHSLRAPDRITIRDIIANAQKRWVLPNFQRYFDWNREDVREFLESIFNDYYVGAFLLWESKGDIELDVISIKGVDAKIENPEAIILDGQQRITSLNYAVSAPDFSLRWTTKPSYFYINFKKFFENQHGDTIIECLYKKYNNDECYKRMLFPFHEIQNYQKWVDGFEAYLAGKSSDTDGLNIRSIIRIIDRRLGHIWDGFAIPYIKLPSTMKLKQVTDIFENINTKGKPLSVFDLLIARLLIFKIKLRDLWDKTRKDYPKLKKYYNKTEKIPIYILQGVSMFYDKNSSCKREDILNIFDNIYAKSDYKFEDHWNEFASYLNQAILKIENMRSGYGAKDEKEVPFVPMLPILAALLKEIDSRTDKAECFKKLDIWYWASVFSNAYSSAVDSRLTADFKELRIWFSDTSQIPRGVTSARRELMSIDFREVETHGNAMYKGILCLLALEGSRDFDTKQTLEMARSNHLDHIFPRSRKFGFGGFRDIDSILNITWMSEDTNTRIKKWAKPSEYVKDFVKQKYAGNESEFKNLLRTHFIDDKAYEHMLNDNFERFILARQTVLMQKISSLIGVDTTTSPSLISPETPFSNKVIFWDMIKECVGCIHWVDKYFSRKGLELLEESLDMDTVKEIKIIMSAEKADETFRKIFKDFKEQMSNEGISCELRVIVDNDLKSAIHDRWIISKNKCFNIPSPDIIARGQYSEIKVTENKPPFEEWWKRSKDIITEWDQIQKFK